jgi:hypothetical protein
MSQLFEPLTKKFSTANTPLIANVLEDLHTLHKSLMNVRDTARIKSLDGAERPNPDVIRVAAHAAILVYEKYIPKLHECEIYAISIGTALYPLSYRCITDITTAMSPDKKLAWFSNHGYTELEVLNIRDMVKYRWATDYAPGAQASAAAPTQVSLAARSRKVRNVLLCDLS